MWLSSRSGRQQSSAAGARTAVTLLRQLWRVVLCWGGDRKLGWVLEVFVVPVCGLRLILSVWCPSWRGWGSGTRYQLLVPPSLTYLRLAGTAADVCCLLTLSSGQRMVWGNSIKTELFSSVLPGWFEFSWITMYRVLQQGFKSLQQPPHPGGHGGSAVLHFWPCWVWLT